jgi:uncharacterized protein (TIGR03435 family)
MEAGTKKTTDKDCTIATNRDGCNVSTLTPALAIAMISGISVAQAQHVVQRQFELASIRKTNAVRPEIWVTPFTYSPSGRFAATTVTLTDVIVMAYKTRRIQMRGGPNWIDSERFDIVAKADMSEGDIKQEEWAPMIQSLLEERFRLRLHRETKVMPVLALVTGNNPPKLQEPKEGEQTLSYRGDSYQLIFQRMPMSALVNSLANLLHTPVVDGTGITGFFDFTLDPLKFVTPTGGKESAEPLTAGSYADLISTAVKEDLGFKLEKQKAPLEITVIDSAERPSDN